MANPFSVWLFHPLHLAGSSRRVIGNCSAAVNFRGEIFAWDPATNRATGASLFESPVYSLPASSSYTLVSFNTAALALPSGMYVFFASTSKDQTGAPSSACRWGSVANTAYPGGNFVYQNNGTTIANWTTATWSQILQDLAFQATFLTYPLTVARTGSGSGTVTSSPAGIDCGSACNASFGGGTSVTLTATPAVGSAFAGWSGGCSGSAATCLVTMSAAMSVTANFTLNTYPLTVTRAGTGSGTVTATGIDCGNDCSETYPYGTAATLTAAPAAGSVFAGWSGDCSGSAATCEVTIVAATSVTATFTQVAGFYAVTPCRVLDRANPNGPWGGPAVAAGTERSFTIAGQCDIPDTATPSRST